MRKFYVTLLLAGCLSANALAASLSVNDAQLRQLDPTQKIAKGPRVTPRGGKVISMKKKTVEPQTRADEEASIEGIWTFTLGDYYFEDSMFTSFESEFDATFVEDNLVWFQDPTGYELPFLATFDAAANTFTFTREYLGTVESLYVYQEPFEWNYTTSNLDFQDIVGRYNPSEGTITFSPDQGLAWTAYRSQNGSQSAGYFSIYDFESAVYGAIEYENDGSIEGTWRITLGDYYGNNAVGDVIFKFVVTLDNGLAVFQDPTNYLLPFVALFDETTNKLTFTNYLLGTVQVDTNQTYYLYQQPFQYVYEPEEGIFPAEFTAQFNPEEGTIEFPVDYGLVWEAFNDAEGTSLAGDLAIFDLVAGVKTANSNSNAVESIDSEDLQAPVEYFDIMGRRVNNPAKGQIVIRKQGKSVSKILSK